jgi:hypothetical protein
VLIAPLTKPAAAPLAHTLLQNGRKKIFITKQLPTGYLKVLLVKYQVEILKKGF